MTFAAVLYFHAVGFLFLGWQICTCGRCGPTVAPGLKAYIPNSKIGMMPVSFTRFPFQAFQPMPVSSLLVSRKSLDGFRV
jgi:hypothetical protein